MDLSESLLSHLTKGTRAAYPYLRSLAGGSQSANQILAQLRSQGVGINRQQGLRVISLLRDKGDVTTFLNTFGDNETIPRSLHKVAPTSFSLGAKYQYTVGTNSQNPDISGAIYVNSDVPLSANEIYSRAIVATTQSGDILGASGSLGETVFSIDDARYTPGEQAANPDVAPPPQDYYSGA